MNKRQSGILLPIFSLPGEYGCGTFSRHAREFVKKIADSGFSLWQVLPFGITDSYHSPYMSLSSFGGNPYFIDPETLYEEGLVTREELEEQKVENPYLCDYAFLEEKRLAFLKKAALRFSDKKAVYAFLEENPDVAGTCRFLALREKNGLRPWNEWTEREPDEEALFVHGFIQYEFHRQWDCLHAFCKDHGIRMIGDLPFYVSRDSYDVWSRPDSFWLDEDFAPVKVAGVPPDYFSPLGQKWGNPLYDWEKMERDGFSYWKARLAYQLRLFDGVRFDHFRAVSGYFAIPAEAENALEGEWLPGPGKALIDAFATVSKGKFLLAEDLGTIDEKTRDLLSYADYPGMAVFQFGFDGNPLSPHLPHNYPENLVAYSGTHDNNTLLGFWFEADEETRRTALQYLGDPKDGVEGTVRALMRSRASRVIFPLQDLLGYGADTRINTPGVATGNWQIRFTTEQIASLDEKKYAEMNRIYARSLSSYHTAQAKKGETMIVTKIKKLRDPFIVLHEGTYYAYGTGVTGTDWANTRWTLYKNTSGDLRGDWERVENLAEIPPHAEKNFWAPEVYPYRGKWYMFTTYFSSLTGRKGCTILAADSPEGPFREITNGHLTPTDWECLDGTLYIDEDEKPWLVFVKEWKCTEDGIGRMMACRLSEDLTRLEGDVTELFSANEPEWTCGKKVTDGCFMVKSKSGKLLMIWSNYSDNGYCVGVSESESGLVTGPWKHGDLLYSRLMSEDYDGGHGMIFSTIEGETVMAIHSPNKPAEDGTEERVILIPIEDLGHTLRWKR